MVANRTKDPVRWFAAHVEYRGLVRNRHLVGGPTPRPCIINRCMTLEVLDFLIFVSASVYSPVPSTIDLLIADGRD